MVIFTGVTSECSEGEECNGESGGDGGESKTTATAGERINNDKPKYIGNKYNVQSYVITV